MATWKKILLLLACLAVLGVTAGLPTRAVAAYPERSITIIVPLTPGGAADITARLIAEQLQRIFGQPVVVENRPGAGTTIGVGAIAKARPDGYTIGLINIASHSIAPTLYGEKLSYDPLKSFVPITLAISSPNILVVNPKRVDARTVDQFIAYAKAHPGKLTYGSSGIGTTLHVGVELLAQVTGTQMTHIPYGGSSQLMNDLVAGHIDFALDGVATAWPQVQAGKLIALAVATPQRLSFAPDLPTLKESYNELEIIAWHGLAAPAGTPKEIIDILSEKIQGVLKLQIVREKFDQQKLVVIGGSPKDFEDFIATDLKRWTPIVKASGAAAK